LFQAIQRIATDREKKNNLIENFIRQLEAFINAESLPAKEIMKLPSVERQKILTEQFQAAEQFYKDNPDFIVPDVDPPMDY
jgi:hypothetical protein